MMNPYLAALAATPMVYLLLVLTFVSLFFGAIGAIWSFAIAAVLIMNIVGAFRHIRRVAKFAAEHPV